MEYVEQAEAVAALFEDGALWEVGPSGWLQIDALDLSTPEAFVLSLGRILAALIGVHAARELTRKLGGAALARASLAAAVGPQLAFADGVFYELDAGGVRRELGAVDATTTDSLLASLRRVMAALQNRHPYD